MARVEFSATKHRMGGRDVYSFTVPLAQLSSLAPVPNPDQPFPGNRRVNPRHGGLFGQYIRERYDWVAPPILLRIPEYAVSFSAEASKSDGVIRGKISIDTGNTPGDHVGIIDGQHRVYGIHHTFEKLDRDRESAEVQQMEMIDEVMNRLKQESITVELFVEDRQEKYEQMFFDIAENPLKMRKGIKIRFNNQDPLDRMIMMVLSQHELLAKNIDEEQDRVAGASQYLLPLSAVQTLAKGSMAGLGGFSGVTADTWTKDPDSMKSRFEEFLDVLVESFPKLRKFSEDEGDAPLLRQTSLLGSATMLRYLAMAFGELRNDGKEPLEIAAHFKRLNSHMLAPITEDSIWQEYLPNVFPLGAKAGSSRNQDLVAAASMLVEWFDEAPEELD
jgi:DGQHR domain-containing protein